MCCGCVQKVMQLNEPQTEDNERGVIINVASIAAFARPDRQDTRQARGYRRHDPAHRP